MPGAQPFIYHGGDVGSLFLHGFTGTAQDTTVNPGTMPRIYERFGIQDKRMMWLENSGHIVTVDCERHLVYASIRDWIKERT